MTNIKYYGAAPAIAAVHALSATNHLPPSPDTSSRWRAPIASLLVIALAGLAGCAAGTVSDDAVPTFEEFRASLTRFEDSYTVEGDLAIHSDAELRDYYARHVAPADETVGASRQGLVVGQTTDGTNLFYEVVPEPTRHAMTYCVSNDFGSKKADVVKYMQAAALAWHSKIRVTFSYASAHDNNCTSSNEGVYFNVRPVPHSPLPGFLARAFFPSWSRKYREVLIDEALVYKLENQTLRHELGHTLGFRHEFNHASYGKPSCREVGASGYAYPLPYDPKSVMHYIDGTIGGCTGTQSTYSISHLDEMMAQWLYGPNWDRCSEAAEDTCFARDAWCEPAYDTSGKRSDLCRWPNISKSECEAPTRRGGWTTASSTFSQVWPSAVPDGASAACVTQVNNVSCSVADQALCLGKGASCERAYSNNGVRHDICRWADVSSASECPAPGAWTTRTSAFAQVWPSAVGLWPSSRPGACITQVGNLK